MSVEALPAPATADSGSTAHTEPRWTLDRSFGRVHAVVFLAVLMLISLFFRTRGLHVHFWVDEGLSVGIAGHPLSKIPHLLREDGSPPLYYVILHGWMQLRGHSEVATHELSLIIALIAIPISFWAGLTIFGRRVAVYAAVIAALVPYLTGYAQETRMYSLMSVFSILVAASFVLCFVQRRRGYLPLFVLSLTGALYTHNWGLFLALMCAVAFLVNVRLTDSEDRRQLWIDGVIALVGVTVLFAPWLPTLLYQAKHTGAPWDTPPVVWSISQGFYYLTGGRGAAMLILIGAGAGLWAIDRHSQAERPLRAAVISLALLGLGTLAVAWLYSKHTPAWAPRYQAAIIGPMLLLVSLGLVRAGRLGIVCLALCATFWMIDPIDHNPSGKSNVAVAIAGVRPHIKTDPLVLSTQPEQVPTIAYYLDRPAHYWTPMGPTADPGVVDWRNALHRLRESSASKVLEPALRTLKPGQRVVLVVPIHFPNTPLWMKDINRSSKLWERVLNEDPKLVRVGSSAKHSYGIGSAVRVTVYAQR